MESIEELKLLRKLLTKMYIECDPDTRLINRILLSSLDFGERIPNEKELGIIDQRVWMYDIGRVVEYKKKKIYNHNNFTEFTLPIRVGGKWLLVLCLPKYGEFQIVVFNEWEWNAVDVHKMMNAVMARLKDAAFNTHQRLKQAAMLEAKE